MPNPLSLPGRRDLSFSFSLPCGSIAFCADLGRGGWWVSHLQDNCDLIVTCDLGFRQLDLQGLRVLAMCLMEKWAEQLRGQRSDWLETVILDVTKTEIIAVASQWGMDHIEL